MKTKIEIKKTWMGTDYSVWIDRDPEGRPDFWVDPQYETITADNETMAAPSNLVELVRTYATQPQPIKERNTEAEVAADIEYTKHHDAVKKMMENNTY